MQNQANLVRLPKLNSYEIEVLTRMWLDDGYAINFSDADWFGDILLEILEDHLVNGDFKQTPYDYLLEMLLYAENVFQPCKEENGITFDPKEYK